MNAYGSMFYKQRHVGSGQVLITEEATELSFWANIFALVKIMHTEYLIKYTMALFLKINPLFSIIVTIRPVFALTTCSPGLLKTI